MTTKLSFDIGTIEHSELAWDFARKCQQQAYRADCITVLPEDMWTEAGRFMVSAYEAAMANPELLINRPSWGRPDITEGALYGDSNE